MICLVYVRANDEAWNMCNMKNIYLSMSQFYSCLEIIPVFEWSVFMPKSPLYLKPGSKIVEIVLISRWLWRDRDQNTCLRILCAGAWAWDSLACSSQPQLEKFTDIIPTQVCYLVLSSQSILQLIKMYFNLTQTLPLKKQILGSTFSWRRELTTPSIYQ